ncbi:hypothetical protein ACIF8W_36470 [Streptomyces sp. NPDC085639]
MVAGTVERPELFHLVGDPDAGDLRFLRRVAPARVPVPPHG